MEFILARQAIPEPIEGSYGCRIGTASGGGLWIIKIEDLYWVFINTFDENGGFGNGALCGFQGTGRFDGNRLHLWEDGDKRVTDINITIEGDRAIIVGGDSRCGWNGFMSYTYAKEMRPKSDEDYLLY